MSKFTDTEGSVSKFVGATPSEYFPVNFWRPFIKRFALCSCYRSAVCLSVLSVTLVYCGQTVGRIKMKLGMQVGLVPGHIVLDGNPAPSPKGHSPQFSVHVCCGEMGELTKMPLGTKVGVGPSDIVLCGNPAPPKRGTAPVFGPCLLWPNGRPSQLLLSTGILKTCCQISEKCRGSQL